MLKLKIRRKRINNMATSKSPFKVYQNFLSAKACESIVDELGFYVPDTDEEGNPIKMFRHHEPSSVKIYSHFKQLIPQLEQYYDFSHRGTEDLTFEFIAEGCTPVPLCENSNYINKKWAFGPLLFFPISPPAVRARQQKTPYRGFVSTKTLVAGARSAYSISDRSTSLARDYTAIPVCPATLAADQPTI